MSTTLGEMNKKINDLSRLRDQIDEVRAEASRLNTQKLELEDEILKHLEENDLTKFDGEMGRVTRVARFDVKFPKDDEANKGALREFLIAKGHFENMWSINHQSLNSWYKAELEAAKERGVDDFDIPGLEPMDRITIQFRRAKK